MTTVHYSPMQPNASGRALAACGVWSPHFTADPDLITCPACIALRKPTPTPTKTETTNMRTLLTLTTALLLAAACDPVDTASTTDTEEAETDDSGTSGGDDADPTGGDDPGTGGEELTCSSGTTGADAACFGVPCHEGTGVVCPEGLTCETHPITKQPRCAMPCGFARQCDNVIPFLCDGDELMAVECVADESRPDILGLCFFE